MAQFVVFITHHWILSALFAFTLVALLINQLFESRFGLPSITPEHAVQLINHQEAVVFDIRSESAFAEGHILDAIHVPVLQLDKKMGVLQKYFTKPVVVICATGQESSKMATLLLQKGFLNVLTLSGGLQSWKAASLPLVKV